MEIPYDIEVDSDDLAFPVSFRLFFCLLTNSFFFFRVYSIFPQQIINKSKLFLANLFSGQLCHLTSLTVKTLEKKLDRKIDYIGVTLCS